MATEPMIRIEADRDPEFAAWFTGLVGEEKLRECIHCGVCSGSCPLASHMDLGPRKLMYLAREGWADDVLGSNTIWLCTSCYACTVACPQQIPVTDVMYALKRKAIEAGKAPKRHPVAVMAKQFSRMVHRRGRMSEAYLIAGLALRSGVHRYVGMLPMGVNAVRTGRISLKLDRIRRRKELTALLDRVEREREEVAAS
ncbi:MAG: 4Fe-4S dicluster domain-containing protein [Actinobacteria bacterium]|nr:4Fe-4S dicluster domain-containing protein [Actinomycetota bacterium]